MPRSLAHERRKEAQKGLVMLERAKRMEPFRNRPSFRCPGRRHRTRVLLILVLWMVSPARLLGHGEGHLTYVAVFVEGEEEFDASLGCAPKPTRVAYKNPMQAIEGCSWSTFEAAWEQRRRSGWKLIDIETFLMDGTRRFVGIYRKSESALGDLLNRYSRSKASLQWLEEEIRGLGDVRLHDLEVFWDRQEGSYEVLAVLHSANESVQTHLVEAKKPGAFQKAVRAYAPDPGPSCEALALRDIESFKDRWGRLRYLAVLGCADPSVADTPLVYGSWKTVDGHYHEPSGSTESFDAAKLVDLELIPTPDGGFEATGFWTAEGIEADEDHLCIGPYFYDKTTPARGSESSLCSDFFVQWNEGKRLVDLDILGELPEPVPLQQQRVARIELPSRVIQPDPPAMYLRSGGWVHPKVRLQWVDSPEMHVRVLLYQDLVIEVHSQIVHNAGSNGPPEAP